MTSIGFFSRVPLKLITPVALTLPVVIVVGVIGVIVYAQGKAGARTLQLRGVEQIQGRIDDRLRTLLNGPQRWSRLVMQQIAAGDLDRSDLRSWRETIYEQRTAFDPTLAGIVWGDAQGHATWVFRYPGKPLWEFGIKDEQTGDRIEEYAIKPDGELSEQPVGGYEYDPTVRPWYVAGQNADAAGVWGLPYAWVNGDGGRLTLGLPFVAPLRDASGELQGVLSSEVSLEDLSVFLEGLTIGKTGFAVVFDEYGRLIATSTGCAVSTEDFNRVTAVKSGDPNVSAAVSTFSKALPGGWKDFVSNWTGPVDLPDGPAVMSVSKFKSQHGLQWMVATVVPVADFTAEVDAIRSRALRIALSAFGLTILLGLALAAWMVRPVLHLTDHAQRVGEGELDREIQLTQARELVHLSNEFNAMTAGLRDRMQLRKSLAMAMEVQQSLLPGSDPVVEGLQIKGHSTYCDETGGDYYDYLDDPVLGDRGVVLVVGDVMGHGIASAMLMATARGVLRSRSQEPGSMSAMMTHLNELLVEVTGGRRFMTMMIARVDPATREMRWVSAGHDPAFVYDPQADTFAEMDGGGLPLGVMAEEVYEENEPVSLAPGAVVVVATDGMWETRSPGGEMYGKVRLTDSIRRHAHKTAEEIAQALHEDLRDFRGDASQDDDETFVVVKVVGEAPGDGG